MRKALAGNSNKVIIMIKLIMIKYDDDDVDDDNHLHSNKVIMMIRMVMIIDDADDDNDLRSQKTKDLHFMTSEAKSVQTCQTTEEITKLMPEDFNKKLKEWEQIKEGKPSPR